MKGPEMGMEKRKKEKIMAETVGKHRPGGVSRKKQPYSEKRAV